MLYFLCLVVVLLLAQDSSSMEFLIKHKVSKKFVHPHNSDVAIPDNDELVIFSGEYENIYMTFESVENEWGYLRHVKSGKNFHPKGGALDPADTTKVVICDEEAVQAYFAIDQVNDHIVHRSGKFIHPKTGDSAYVPPNNTPLVIHHDIHDNMKFELVNISNYDEMVFPYGDAEIIGEWKLVFSLENALVTHKETYVVSLGKSETESVSSSVQFVWECNADAQMYFAKMSTSVSLSDEINQSTKETWNVEVTRIDTIIVKAGQSVATWQKRYIGSHLGHTAVHGSTMLADTPGPDIKPGESEYTRYRFI